MHRPCAAARARPAVLVLAILMGAGCESSPLETDDDHPEVNGLTIVRNGQILARVTGAGQPQGQISVPVGDSLGVAVVVFDFDGETVLLDADEFIEVEVTIESVATFAHSSPRASSGTFHGHAVGQTSFVIRLRHGDPAHTDFLSPSIPLVVTP
ncbi:MAG: hypothetical protein WEB88_15935 [Gemmatimonadota bacterium]